VSIVHRISVSWSEPPEIGPFVVEQRLAHQPGVESVYAAHDSRHSEPVTLRLLWFVGGPSAPAWRAHGRAMARWRRLDHRGLATLVDTGRGRQGVWVATRRTAGSSLTELLRGSRPLAPDRVMAMLAPVAEALDLVDAHDLVCDSLTGDTVVVYGPPGGERALLIAVGPAWPPASRPGRLLGPPDGLAPEEIRGGAPNRASNVYALGALLVRCLTGAPPFPASSRAAVLTAHLHAPAPSVSARCPALPPALDEVLAAALSKTPGQRPASAGELMRWAADALGQEAGGSPAFPAGKAAVAAPPAQPLPALAPAAQLLAPAAQVLAPAAASTAPDAGGHGRRRSESHTRLRRVAARAVLLTPVLMLIAVAAYLSTHQPSGVGPAPRRAMQVPDAPPPGGGRAFTGATLRPPASAVGGQAATGAVRIEARGERLVLTIAGEHLPAEGRDPVQAYTVWLINSRRDSLRLGAIDPPVGASGSFLNHGTLPAGSQRYRRIVVTLESQLGERPAGPIVLTARLRIPER
jgi:hypothetical protein